MKVSNSVKMLEGFTSDFHEWKLSRNSLESWTLISFFSQFTTSHLLFDIVSNDFLCSHQQFSLYAILKLKPQWNLTRFFFLGKNIITFVSLGEKLIAIFSFLIWSSCSCEVRGSSSISVHLEINEIWYTTKSDMAEAFLWNNYGWNKV